MPTITPTYPQYTNLSLGEGLFDQLMATVKHHIHQEWDAQRIRGDLYAKTYLGSMEAVMQNTTQYLLGILLIDEKKEQIELQNKILELQAEELRFKIDFLYPLELQKLQLELLKVQGELDLIAAQIEKINKEIEFLTAKILSEQANVDGSFVNPVSVIGRQMELLRAQKLGFAGDLEAKAAKIQADYATLFQSVHENPDDVTLNIQALTSVNWILETVEKIKDDLFVDPVFVPFEVPITPP